MARDAHRKLKAWRQAMRVVQRTYHLTDQFPADEKSGLSATIRKAAAAIPVALSQIHRDRSPQQLQKLIEQAQRGADELAGYLEVAEQLRYGSHWRRKRSQKQTQQLIEQVDRLRRTVQKDADPQAA